MNVLPVDELKELAEQHHEMCVSVYMPMIRLGAEVQQNPIRFKNVMRSVETKVQEYRRDISSAEMSSLLRPAQGLDQDEFWQHQEEGLALFLAEGFFRYYRLPLPFEELVMVSDRFHLKPLMPLLTGDGQFYILALSQQQIRLYEGSRYSVQELEVEDLPQDIHEVLQYDETSREGQFRLGTSPGTGRGSHRAGSFHGQGSPDRDDQKRNILQFFHQVDKVVHEFLGTQQAPLVLAGVDYLLPVYHEANTYPHLMDEGISESPKVMKPEELHTLAWAIAEPYYTHAQQDAVELYQELATTEKATSKLEDVVSAAYYGRVEQLFVAVGEQKWGKFDPATNELQLHADAEPGDEDLLNAAAIQTLLNSGTVYALEPGQVPDDAPVAAIFRY
ncbi:hypothetical protein ACQ4M4_02920 [Leptolyngbya sp. AN02str]|uniref:baeRF7 domain-containing protein n=1 Tax=Leptolyngbya sp. AN02str TaxID=3423363 RepID=UPI003D310E92